MRTLSFTAVALTLCANLAAQKDETPKVEPGLSAPRGKTLEWKSPAGQPYWYRLPEKLEAKQPVTLTFMFHGTGMKFGWAFWNYPIANGGFRKNDIVIAPEGMTPGNGDTFNFVQGKADGEQIEGLIQFFKKKFTIGRIYLYGHSQGAFFSYWMAGEAPELIDGIVAHAGNVLDVKHTPLSKQKLAVGILHGRADAVVPVDCAYRTEKIYREQGYQKLKLKVVEGLNDQTGHWPLPDDVAEMFSWLDKVSSATLEDAAAEVAYALETPTLDLQGLKVALDRAQLLAKKAKPAEVTATKPRIDAGRELLARAATEHAKVMSEDPAIKDPKLPFGGYAGHLLAVDSALESEAPWAQATKVLRPLIQKHAKAMDKALADAAASEKRSFATLLKAIEESPLSPRLPEALGSLERLANSPPKGISKEDAGKALKLIAERRTSLEEGRTKAAKLTQALRPSKSEPAKENPAPEGGG